MATLAEIRAKLKGKKLSEETKQKMRSTKLGKINSKEAISKRSATRKIKRSLCIFSISLKSRVSYYSF
jgi:hypothetical protein